MYLPGGGIWVYYEGGGLKSRDFEKLTYKTYGSVIYDENAMQKIINDGDIDYYKKYILAINKGLTLSVMQLVRAQQDPNIKLGYFQCKHAAIPQNLPTFMDTFCWYVYNQKDNAILQKVIEENRADITKVMQKYAPKLNLRLLSPSERRKTHLKGTNAIDITSRGTKATATVLLENGVEERFLANQDFIRPYLEANSQYLPELVRVILINAIIDTIDYYELDDPEKIKYLQTKYGGKKL